jgi:hypothetical protein
MKRETNSPRVPVTVEMAQEDLLLTTKQTAKVLAMSADTLRDWRYSKPPVGAAFIKVGGVIRYRLGDLLEYLDKRTVRPERSAPFYRRTRIEELGLKHPGLCEFVEKELRKRVSQPRVAEAVLNRWHERISVQVISSFYRLRVAPKIWAEEKAWAETKKILNEERSQDLSR